MKRLIGLAAALAIVLALAPSNQAQYRYRGTGGGSEANGFFVILEGGVANPRNVDAVAATVNELSGGIRSSTAIIPEWGDEAAGRVTLGFGFGEGNRVGLSYFGFESDVRSGANGPAAGSIDYAIGPPVPDGSGGFIGAGGFPGYFDITTEVTAEVVDLAWGKRHEVSESFDIGFTAGLRMATYEERSFGRYDDARSDSSAFGVISYFDVDKRIESEMIGVRVALDGTVALSQRVGVRGSLGFSQLGGEITAGSTLIPLGSANAGRPIGFAPIADDSRSGQIQETELALVWSSESGRFKLWGGWEQSDWRDVPADLVRNHAGTAAPLAPRDAVTISWFKLGAMVTF